MRDARYARLISWTLQSGSEQLYQERCRWCIRDFMSAPSIYKFEKISLSSLAKVQWINMSLAETTFKFANAGERTYLINLIVQARINNVFLLLIIYFLADFVTVVCLLCSCLLIVNCLCGCFLVIFNKVVDIFLKMVKRQWIAACK